MTPRPHARRPAAKRIPQPLSVLVETLKVMLRADGLPAPVEELVFAPPRKWAFDLAYPDRKLAIECEGGTHSGGRHVRGKGYENDCEKYNEAQLLGWTVLRFTMGMINNGTAIEQIRRAHENRGRV